MEGKEKLVLVAIRIDDEVKWEILSPRDSQDSFVAVCDQLGLSVEAKSEAELRVAAQKALEVLTDDLSEHNDAIPFLLTHKIKFQIQPVKTTSAGFVLPVPMMRGTEGDAVSA